MEIINSTTGERIKRMREEHRWLQRDLADRSGLPLRTIGRIERGEVDVRLSTLSKIAKAFEVHVSELVS